MSVTFKANNLRSELADRTSYLNVCNANARDLLQWLGLPVTESLSGDIPARELAARCRRRLWDSKRNHDPELPTIIQKTPGKCTVVEFGRRPDYLREKTEHLLRLCHRAGDGIIYWS